MITLLLLVRATYIYGVVLYAHPFVVNHTINATPPERLQHRFHVLLYTRGLQPLLLKGQTQLKD